MMTWVSINTRGYLLSHMTKCHSGAVSSPQLEYQPILCSVMTNCSPKTITARLGEDRLPSPSLPPTETLEFTLPISQTSGSLTKMGEEEDSGERTDS